MRAERKMMALVCRRGVAPGLLLVLASAVFTAGSAGGQPLATVAEAVPVMVPGGMVVVHVDQAKIMKLPDRTATLVIGNPLIADAVVQPGGVVVITAKSYGATNLVALDRTGATLLDARIQVVATADRVVVVYRGVDRETYSCMPHCQRRITVGDAPAYFDASLGQVSSFGAQAQGSGHGQAK
jgi:Flp pilus assembly secretin CpaC